jgi:hypothetical protein
LLNRKILRLGASEQAVDVRGRAALQVGIIGRIGQEQRGLGVAAPGCGNRYATRQSHSRDHAARSAQRTGVDNQKSIRLLREGFGESPLDVPTPLGLDPKSLDAERVRSRLQGVVGLAVVVKDGGLLGYFRYHSAKIHPCRFRVSD